VEKAKNLAFFGIANRYHKRGPKWQKLPFDGGDFKSVSKAESDTFEFEINRLQRILNLIEKSLPVTASAPFLYLRFGIYPAASPLDAHPRHNA